MSGAMDALWDEVVKMKNYRPILQSLEKRILEKHEKYGVSYLNKSCTLNWLFNTRLLGEISELGMVLFTEKMDEEKKTESIVDEALDVAIVALLIADKKRREGE